MKRLACIGSTFALALGSACAPQSDRGTQDLVSLAPAALEAPANDGAQDGIELPSEEALGRAGRYARVSIVLSRDLKLQPSMEELGLTEEYSAYLQDGVSKHGHRNYSDAFLPKLLRDRPFCLVRFIPFQNEEQRSAARAKVLTDDLKMRLKNADLARTLPKGERLVFTVDHSSERYDPRSRLTNVMLYPANQDARSPQFITRVKCVGREANVEVLRSAFGERVVRGFE